MKIFTLVKQDVRVQSGVTTSVSTEPELESGRCQDTECKDQYQSNNLWICAEWPLVPDMYPCQRSARESLHLVDIVEEKAVELMPNLDRNQNLIPRWV